MGYQIDEDGNRIVSAANPELATYYATAQIAGPSGGGPGGTNKAMLSFLNPASSGKVIKLRLVEYFSLGSSGTAVYIDVQLRRITAHSGGTAITPSKRDTTDAAAVMEVRSEPSSVTGGAASDIIQQMAVQSNNPSAGEGYRFRMGTTPDERPITLREGEGFVIHHVTSNGGTFAPGVVWTEE